MRKVKNQYISSCQGSYILELALLLPVLVGFTIGLTEVINIARANSALSEAVNFGVRELATVAGRGVTLHDPLKKQRFNWFQYRKVGNTVQKTRIATNSSAIPGACLVKDSSNIGCSRVLNGPTSPDFYNTKSFDSNKVIKEFVEKEIFASRLPEADFKCANMNKRGCAQASAQLIAGTANSLNQYRLEITYNAPTPILGSLVGKKYIAITAAQNAILEPELADTNPLIINGDVTVEYDD